MYKEDKDELAVTYCTVVREEGIERGMNIF